jgi:hypothetical protein
VPAAVPGEDGYLLDDLIINLNSRRGATRGSADYDDVAGSIMPSRLARKTKSDDDRWSSH